MTARSPSTKDSFSKARLSAEKNRSSQPHIVDLGDKTDDLYALGSFERKCMLFLPWAAFGIMFSSFYLYYVQYSFLETVHLAGSGIYADMAIRRAYILLDIIVNIPEMLKKWLDGTAISQRVGRPRLRVYGDDVPRVDVAILCCKEDVDIILDTVRAVLCLDYPDDRLRIIVSDDGADPAVERNIARLRLQYPHRELHYTARQRRPWDSHKAGNLNALLAYTAAAERGEPAAYLAGLDADMIPAPHWLRAMVPHLLRDPRVAFACPPPAFYNVPRDDPLSQSLFVFHRYEEVLKDAAGVAWCTGSGWVMRRDALEGLGGFPTNCLTEDVLCGKMLLGQGWKSVYVQESLQWGLVPETYHAHIVQRQRWSTGGLQAGLLMRLCLYGDKAKHMDFYQRAYSAWYLYQNLSATLKTLEIVKCAFLMLGAWPHVVFADMGQLKTMIRIAATGQLFSFIHRLLESGVQGYTQSAAYVCSYFYLNAYFAVDHLKTFILPTWLGGRPDRFTAKFPSTGSMKNSKIPEWNPSQRAPLHKRLKSVLFDDGAIFHTSVAFFMVFAALWNIHTANKLYPDDTRRYACYLLPRIAWINMTWPEYTAGYLRPLWYALFPPNVADREDLLSRDAAGVAYPRPDSKLPTSPVRGFGLEAIQTIGAAYALGMFVSTFYW